MFQKMRKFVSILMLFTLIASSIPYGVVADR